MRSISRTLLPSKPHSPSLFTPNLHNCRPEKISDLQTAPSIGMEQIPITSIKCLRCARIKSKSQYLPSSIFKQTSFDRNESSSRSCVYSHVFFPCSDFLTRTARQLTSSTPLTVRPSSSSYFFPSSTPPHTASINLCRQANLNLISRRCFCMPSTIAPSYGTVPCVLGGRCVLRSRSSFGGVCVPTTSDRFHREALSGDFDLLYFGAVCVFVCVEIRSLS